MTQWLYELQETDLELERRREALKQVEEQLGQDDVLVQAHTALDEKQREVADLEHRQQAMEWEVENLKARITPLEQKLYGGSVQSPKELLGMQQEAEYRKAQRREREDRLLEIMESLDSTRQSLMVQRGEVQELELNWRQEQERLEQEQKQLQAELAILDQKQALISAQIDSRDLELYRALRQEKQGLAVAKVRQGRCLGCRVVLPMSTLRRPRAGRELPRCSNCGRIIYLE